MRCHFQPPRPTQSACIFDRCQHPAFYQKLSEKLEALIQKHKDDWNQLYLELKDLRDEAERGRQDEIEGVSATEAPFYDLIGKIAYGGEIPEEDSEQIKSLVSDVVNEFQKTIDIINFWDNGFEVEKLKGQLSDLMLFTNLDPIIENTDLIVSEITSLAKVRHKDILG